MFSTTVFAADTIVIIPLNSGKLSCSGTINDSRWCDNGDGTITDITTGLVWLKNANCFGSKKWGDAAGDDSHTVSGRLSDPDCSLSDGSTTGDWRLPTIEELSGLANGTDAVRSSSQRAFTGVQSADYCSSGTHYYAHSAARLVDLSDGSAASNTKTTPCGVLPVRGKQKISHSMIP